MRRSASEIINELEARIAKLEKQGTGKGSRALWESQNVKQYRKYLAVVRKTLKALGFVFGRVQEYDRPRAIGMKMAFEYQGKEGLIFIDQGNEGYYDTLNSRKNSKLVFRLGKDSILQVEGTNENHIGYTHSVFSDISSRDVKLFVSKLKTYFTTSEGESLKEIKSFVQSLWKKNGMGEMSLSLPNRHQYIVHEGKGRRYGYKEEGYYIELKSPDISSRHDWIIDATGERGTKKAMTKSQAIKMATRLAIASLSKSIL